MRGLNKNRQVSSDFIASQQPKKFAQSGHFLSCFYYKHRQADQTANIAKCYPVIRVRHDVDWATVQAKPYRCNLLHMDKICIVLRVEKKFQRNGMKTTKKNELTT
jgi:hypothetical protein